MVNNVLVSIVSYFSLECFRTLLFHRSTKTIVGGAEGASLREVLKHNTIESVTMIEIDEELVEILKEHMPKMSNCSDFIGRAENCFDDEKANLVFDDGK